MVRGVTLHVQVYEGSGRSMLLSSCRGEAKLWDVGACKDRAEALWAPNETIGDSLRTFEGVRSAVFRPDGLLVNFLACASFGYGAISM